MSTDDDQEFAVNTLIEDHLIRAGDHFVDELVYRFLLNIGARWRRSVEKVGRQVAYRRFARAIAAALLLRDIPTWARISAQSPWERWDAGTNDIPLSISGLAWRNSNEPRVLLFDCSVTPAKSKLDVAILRYSHGQLQRLGPVTDPGVCVGFGEIESEVPVPGSTGSWRLHRRILARARGATQGIEQAPYLFFVGSVLRDAVAAEVWQALEAGLLTNVANGRNDAQLGALCQWVVQS